MKKNINCRNCRHFFITWNKKTPYGCKAFSMKSYIFPSILVFKQSRKECLYFIKK